jgi:antitoxin HicB
MVNGSRHRVLALALVAVQFHHDPLPTTSARPISFLMLGANRRCRARRLEATRIIDRLAVPYDESPAFSEACFVNLARTYTVVLQPEPEGGFTVRVPALPEIVTYGEDETEALAMAKEAIELAIQHRASVGEEIPASQSTPIREVTVLVPAA